MTADTGRAARAARIGLRVISSPGWRGGVNYIVNWVRACAGVPADERPEIWLLPYDERGERIAAELSDMVAGIQQFARAEELDLDMVYPATQIFEAPFGAPWAGWVPDWQCKHLPEFFDEVELARRDLHYGLLARRAPFLVLSSQMALDDSRRLYAEQLVPHARLPFPALFDPAEVASARANLSAVRARFDLPQQYFLVANQWWRHKNHRLIIDALSRLDSDAPVVCTGATSDHRWPEYPGDLLEEVKARGLAARLRVLGCVERSDQLALMLGAVSIIQPSRFEGWSTVVEEARALDLPILMSRIPVHEEQSPPRSRFFDCDDAEELADAMGAALEAGPAPAPPTAEEPTHAEYVRSCVGRLCAVARAVRQVYEPKRHHPAELLADLTAGLDAYPRSPAMTALTNKVLSATRAMLATSPAAADRYLSALAKRHPDKLPALEASVATRARRPSLLIQEGSRQPNVARSWTDRFRKLFSRSARQPDSGK